jgi:branched-chain amino acid transport system ATP-binding protein
VSAASPAPAAALPGTSSGPLLEVRGVSKVFGGFRALDDVSLELAPGAVLGLVGPNGSGKTTLINVITGLLSPSGGHVSFGGRDVTGWGSHRLAHLGVNRSFQIPKPFLGLSVLENLEVAARYGHGTHDLDEVLAVTNLGRVASRLAEELTASEQKRLDLARALATGPRLLCVDELGAGLSVSELDEVAVMLRRLVEEWGIALIVVEHLMGFLGRVTEEVVVLNAGQVIFRGSLTAALEDQTVVRVFLGG